MKMTSELVGVDNLDMSEVEDFPVSVRAFSLFDRCERCGFQAYYVAWKGESELCFCFHHGQQHYTALLSDGWKIKDFTNELTTKVIEENTVLEKSR